MPTHAAYIKTALTGGTTNALDGIDGANLNANDMAFVERNSETWLYTLTTDASTERSPWAITPDSNPGSKAWKRRDIFLKNEPSSSALVLTNYGISRLSSTKNCVARLSVPAAGVHKTILANTTFAIAIKGSTAATVRFGTTLGGTVVTIANTTKTKKYFGRGVSLLGASTVLWYVLPGSTAGLSFATST